MGEIQAGQRDGSDRAPTPAPEHPAPARDLARELTGDLPCARCRYNLRGVSILEVCPECGLPVKATILALVDPEADEIRAIDHPRIVQVGLLAWSACAFAAALCVWVIRGVEILDRLGVSIAAPWQLVKAVVVLLFMSALGSLVLVRPHGGISKRDSLRALLGSLCYVPLAWATWFILANLDPGSVSVYTRLGGISPERSLARIVSGVSIIGIALLLRPNALRLALRSVLVRTGRVDRQPMTALAGAAGLALIGDVLHLLGPYAPGGGSDLLFVAGVAAIVAGSLLLTVGLLSLTLDTLRIWPLISAPGIGLVDIFDQDQGG